MTGELTRRFLKHKVYGTVFAVEQDETGLVLAALAVGEAGSCRHQLEKYGLKLDGAEEIAKHMRDYEIFDPACVEPTHLLADIGAAEKACQDAELEWQQAHTRAKALKEAFEGTQDALRQIVRDATNPKPMPLFDASAA
jgi:hypothetical protein